MANSVYSVNITPTVNDPNATCALQVNGSTVTNPVSLSVGANPINIVVTAQDSTEKTYSLTVTRMAAAPPSSSDATLSSLTISSGSLSPAFASGTTSYTDSVASSVYSVTVTPTADNSNANITVNGTTVASGSVSGPISVGTGGATITILVTAPDGTQQTYTISVSVNGGGGGASSGSPVINSISPASGTSDGGTSVIITGSGFTGATAVSFGSTPAASFAVNSDTQITAASPAATGLPVTSGNPTVDVVITTASGASSTSASDQFTYIPAGYMGMNKGASVLTTALNGTDTGGLIFTKGNSQYYSNLAPGSTYTVNFTVDGIPAGASIIAARLYNYYCWSVTGQPAQESMTMNGQSAMLLNSYSDTKGMAPYNYPFGTVAFDATHIMSGNGSYAAVMTNNGAGTICPFGTGLVIVYHDPNGSPFEYWLNEGADLIWPGDGVTPQEATTSTSFLGSIDTSKVYSAELITVVTSGDKGLNTLTFNGTGWYGVYKDPSQLAVDDRDVTADLQSSNSLSIQSDGAGSMGSGTGSSSFSEADAMVPSNAFLVVTYNSPNSSESGSITPGTGGTVSLGSAITVTIPAGALNGSENVNIAIQKVNTPPAIPSGLSLLGSVFELTVGGASGYTFATPVTLTFTIDSAALTTGETPAIYYYDQTSSQWVELGGTVSGNTISVDVDHFTKFAVLVEATAQLAPAPTTPAPTAVLQAPFSDVPAGYWASSVIDEVYSRGFVSGYPDGTFRPHKSITRAEFVTILVKAFKLPVVSDIFFDDTARNWARDYIGTAYHAGIAAGYSDNSFGPDDPITREQMAMMIAGAAKLKTPVTQSNFQDRDRISAWARSALAAVAQAGIMKGYPDGTFDPQRHATRAEAVAAIATALQYGQQ